MSKKLPAEEILVNTWFGQFADKAKRKTSTENHLEQHPDRLRIQELEQQNQQLRLANSVLKMTTEFFALDLG